MLQFCALTLDKRLLQVSGHAIGGQFVHVLGANGAGKSTLLAALSGLLVAKSGDITLQGQPLQDYSLHQLAQIRCLQEQQQNSVFAISVQESLAFFAPKSDFPAPLEQALEIAQFLSRSLMELSGGESRRVQIARALWQIWPAIKDGRGVILLDEPTQGLDFRHQHLLLQMLTGLASLGNVIIISHHDLNLCQQYAHQVWLMRSGAMVCQGAPGTIMTIKQLSAVFGCEVRNFVDSQGNKLWQTYVTQAQQ